MGLQAFLGGIGAMIGWGGSDFFVKSVVEKVGAVRTLIWVQLLGALVVGIIGGITGMEFAIKRDLWLGLAFFCITDALGYWLFFKAMEKGKVSVVGPVFACYAAGAVLFSVILGEKIGVLTGVLIFTMFLGILLSSMERVEKIKLGMLKNLGVLLAFLGALVFSFWYPLWEKFSESSSDWMAMTFWLRIGVAIFLMMVLGVGKVRLYESHWKNVEWKFLGLGGLFDASAYMALTWGYMSLEGTSITTILGSAYSLPTLILANVFLKERLNWLQKVGVGLILVSLVGISLSS